MGYYHRMATPFCNDCFTDIAGGIEIEMWTVANQDLCPIGLRQASVFARSELKIAVCAKMNEGIGIKSFLHIKIWRDI